MCTAAGPRQPAGSGAAVSLSASRDPPLIGGELPGLTACGKSGGYYAGTGSVARARSLG
jgi:hypothetical protein